ncbi:MAG: molybdenum cofactor guanylyltransferase [Bacteroidota bacterium]
MGINAAQASALILAGGQSRRFGSNKAHARVHGKPMVNRVFDVLDACFKDVAISTADPSISFDVPAPHIPDVYPNTGPLSGLYSGFIRTTAPWLFVAAVDLPFITTQAVHLMLEACENTVDGVIATDGKKAQPLFGCYHSRITPALEAFLKQGERAVFSFIKTQNINTVQLPAAVLQNINRPADLPKHQANFKQTGDGTSTR